ncbi:phage tail protein [Erwinia amylovora]|uniref:phage tail-collar fiber domain-containing protein n=1 Tax=Erwinia amylovora TaxID=552 RepID=UPI0014439B64|nr:phage tail protein [Erwinia amylovora]
MATKYFALLTHIGAAKLANATALGTQIEISHMATGDGNGTLPTPNPAQTALVREQRRAPLNMLTIDPVNANQIIAEQVIPENEGGWWIREIGLFDKAGDLVAVANCAETYKPQLQEGSGRVQVIRVILIVSSTDAVTLKIDPSVVLATRQYVDDAVIEVMAYADTLMAEHVAAAEPHPQYLKSSDIAKIMPIGVPIPYPSAIAPDGWLKCNGAAFDKAKYPALATVFPSGNLPDLRGQFIRGWDDGRGVDAGRKLMSNQNDAIQKISGHVGFAANGIFTYADGAFSLIPRDGIEGIITQQGGAAYKQAFFDSSTVVRTADENRPINISFNYIIRAA